MMATVVATDSPLVSKRRQITRSNQQEVKELKILIKSLNNTEHNHKSDTPETSDTVNKTDVTNVSCDCCNEEAERIEQFCLSYENERQFSKHKQAKLFTALFDAVLKNRINNSWLTEKTRPENLFRIVQLLRILLRDPKYQRNLLSLDKISLFTELLDRLTNSYILYIDSPFIVETITELLNIFLKLLSQDGASDKLAVYSVHGSLVRLLSAPDIVILHYALRTLTVFVQSPESCKLVSQLDSVDPLLCIIRDFDDVSKMLAAGLLRYLCSDPQTKEMIKVCDGIPVLLSALQNNSIKLLKYIVWCLVQLSEDADVRNIIRRRGGLPLLLGFLGDNKLLPEKQTPTSENGTASPEMKELKEQYLALKSACCACLTELILSDTNAQQIVQSNGIYSIGRLILPVKGSESVMHATQHLQANAFRTLRFLFSMEKNRQLFKRLFPPELFEKFIDVGSYNKDIGAYFVLVETINKLKPEEIKEIEENLESTNHNRIATRTVNEYSVLELLGAGSYGSVYKVKKLTSESVFAMKEISTQNAIWGASNKERQKSVGDVISELTIIREQLKHPNVVRYYKTFKEQDHLYIVMELIEGAALGEHFSSLKEKNTRFSEDRIWHIFVQLVLALRYLHKEKHIVHRDLTPNNIMLGEGDKVTITDFGLAKVKQAGCSKMESQVGTMLYWGPELILNKPYGEKADIWAIGCILYQMCTLKPPFYSNILSLALKIVNADYEPIPENLYSEKVISTVKHCITVDVEKRPDIIGVASHISDILLLHMDQVNRQCTQMEKKLEHERNRSKMQMSVARQSTPRHQQLYLVSQECYDRLTKSPNSAESPTIREPGLCSEIILCSPETASHTRVLPCVAAISEQATAAGVDGGRNSGENGWGTDEDQYSSSSECNSRASSAGQGHSTDSSQTRNSKLHQTIAENLVKPLTLEIPCAKISRDSGISSGDPSPNTASSVEYVAMDTVSEGMDTPIRPRSYHPSLGSPTLEAIGRRAVRSRPSSATTPTLAISQRKVREINDPILQILHQLHKIIYITQLPPTLNPNPRRRIVERYKRVLFAPGSTSINLKNEMKRLLMGSCDVIDVDFGHVDVLLASSMSEVSQEKRGSSTPTEQSGDDYMESANGVGLTYDQMQNVIERVLVETGYYDFTSQVRQQMVASGTMRSLSVPYHS